MKINIYLLSLWYLCTT